MTSGDAWIIETPSTTQRHTYQPRAAPLIRVQPVAVDQPSGWHRARGPAPLLDSCFLDTQEHQRPAAILMWCLCAHVGAVCRIADQPPGSPSELPAASRRTPHLSSQTASGVVRRRADPAPCPLGCGHRRSPGRARRAPLGRPGWSGAEHRAQPVVGGPRPDQDQPKPAPHARRDHRSHDRRPLREWREPVGAQAVVGGGCSLRTTGGDQRQSRSVVIPVRPATPSCWCARRRPAPPAPQRRHPSGRRPQAPQCPGPPRPPRSGHNAPPRRTRHCLDDRTSPTTWTTCSTAPPASCRRSSRTTRPSADR